uniref:Secreted peptide n=1 Tax=Anopheles braziliensis TaxID=58242 RepID=A0A2M3ZM20_9DIPT
MLIIEYLSATFLLPFMPISRTQASMTSSCLIVISCALPQSYGCPVGMHFYQCTGPPIVRIQFSSSTICSRTFCRHHLCGNRRFASPHARCWCCCSFVFCALLIGSILTGQ